VPSQTRKATSTIRPIATNKIPKKKKESTSSHLFEDNTMQYKKGKVSIVTMEDKHRVECVMHRKRDVYNKEDIFVIMGDGEDQDE
jgi:hypothetical protein